MSKKRITIRMPQELADTVRDMAKKGKRPIGGQATLLIEQFFKVKDVRNKQASALKKKVVRQARKEAAGAECADSFQDTELLRAVREIASEVPKQIVELLAAQHDARVQDILVSYAIMQQEKKLNA